MKRGVIYFFIALLNVNIFSQASAQTISLRSMLQQANSVTITYQRGWNHRILPGKIIMRATEDEAFISAEKFTQADEDLVTEEKFIDYNHLKAYKMAYLPSNEVITTYKIFTYGRGFKEIGEETILGLKCKVAETTVSSNKIKIWYAQEPTIQGTPVLDIGIPEGLVLKIVYNGNRSLTAVAIHPSKKKVKLLPKYWGKFMDDASYNFAIRNAGVKTVSIFKDEKIHFVGADMPDKLVADSTYCVGGGTILIKKVTLPQTVNGYSVFAELTQFSNGDAYERPGSVFVIPTNKLFSYLDAIRSLMVVPAFVSSNGVRYPGLISTPDYTAPLELMRFFTSFGINSHSKLGVLRESRSDSVFYKTNVTALASALRGEVWIGAYIGTWDQKGHSIDLDLKYYPVGRGNNDLKVVPLFNTMNYLEQRGQPYPVFMDTDSLNVDFTIDKDINDARLCYFTTGHGGWEQGDEFNPKINTIFLDGEKVISFLPWRDDCGSFRVFNPAADKLDNGMRLSDFSRSNWCPGVVTSPSYIYLGDLKAGKHHLSIEILSNSKGDEEDLSYWCVSGALIYNENN